MASDCHWRCERCGRSWVPPYDPRLGVPRTPVPCLKACGGLMFRINAPLTVVSMRHHPLQHQRPRRQPWVPRPWSDLLTRDDRRFLRGGGISDA